MTTLTIFARKGGAVGSWVPGWPDRPGARRRRSPSVAAGTTGTVLPPTARQGAFPWSFSASPAVIPAIARARRSAPNVRRANPSKRRAA
jgi:hypothetical protein